jgi:uncharacterized membrane protein required for colicin V production
VDLIGAIKDAPLIDLGILFGLAVFLILGVLQGAIRRLLGMGVLLVAFLFAANTRDEVGDFLSTNWRQFDLGYNRLLAFLIVFIGLSVLANVAIEVMYKRLDVSPAHPIVDDILGSVVGVLEGAFLLVLVVVILGSYSLPPQKPGDLPQLRDAQDLVVDQSHISHWLHETIAPGFVHILSPLLPADLNAVYP